MKSLVTEIIPERLGPVTSDFPDASYKNEAAGVLPTPVLSQFMTSYHYSVLRFLQEAGIAINDQIDNINSNQFWDAYYANTNRFILENSGLSPIAPRLISGATRAISSMPDFLRANGASLEFTILGDTTNLVMSTNNKEFVTNQDIVVSGVTAAPSTNNTADINDVNIVADLYAGESDAIISEIIINNVGSSVSSRVGQIIAFKTPSGEIFQGLLKTSTLITNVFRGYYFDDSGDPIPRNVLYNGNTITMMNIGWVFIDADGATVDVSYLTPISAYDEPSAPVADQYWFDMTNKVWNLYTASFDVVDVVLVGQIVSDDTNTIASRPNDFSNNFKEFNNIELEVDTTEIVDSISKSSRCSVYGTELQIDLTKLVFNITTDLETPLIEAADTDYFLYLSDQGQEIMSTIKPYERLDLKGFYHPYSSYRCVGICYNDGSNNIIIANVIPYNSEISEQVGHLKDVKTSGTSGGTFTSGAWQTRDVNTVGGYFRLFGFLLSNQFILGAGTYEIESTAPAIGAHGHQSRLANISDGTYVYGSSEFSEVTFIASQVSIVKTVVIIAASKLFEIQHRCGVTKVDGLGRPTSFGGSEVYTQVKIRKLK